MAVCHGMEMTELRCSKSYGKFICEVLCRKCGDIIYIRKKVLDNGVIDDDRKQTVYMQ